MAMIPWTANQPLRIRRHLPADQTIFFVSDLHLGDGSRSDSFQGKDEAMIAFLDHVRQQEAHLVIVGDAIDFHQAWFFSRVLRAHSQLFGELSRLADSHGVTYIWGNHDHDISLFKNLLRFDVCSSLQIGDDAIVRHGYEYDPFIGPNLEQTHMATRIHHLIERVFDTWIRLPLEHFYTFPNRIIFWLFHKLVLLNNSLKRLGLHVIANPLREQEMYWIHNQMGDPQGIFPGVQTALEDGPYRWLVTGHSHLPGLVPIAPDRWYVNTGSWTFGSTQYARWDGERFSVHDWVKNKTYDEQYYQPLLSRRFRHMDFLFWWRQNYMGWFRFRIGEAGRVPHISHPKTADESAWTEEPESCA